MECVPRLPQRVSDSDSISWFVEVLAPTEEPVPSVGGMVVERLLRSIHRASEDGGEPLRV